MGKKRAAEAEQHLAAARGHLRAVLEIDETSHEARTNLGVLAYGEGQLDEARRLFDEALARKRADPGTLSNVAFMELGVGRTSEALALVEEALGYDSEHFNARWVRGAVLSELRRFGDARPDLEWVLVREPGKVEVRRLYVACLFELGEHQRCAEQAISLLKDRPREPAVTRTMARALARVVRARPIRRARAFVLSALKQGAIDPGPVVPVVAAELRKLGDAERARLVEGK